MCNEWMKTSNQHQLYTEHLQELDREEHIEGAAWIGPTKKFRRESETDPWEDNSVAAQDQLKPKTVYN